MTHRLKKSLALLVFVAIASPAYAATLDPLQNIIDEIVTFITGPGGIAIGTIVIAGAGLSAAMGRMEWRTFSWPSSVWSWSSAHPQSSAVSSPRPVPVQ